MKKRSTRATVDEIVTRDVAAIARGVPVEEATTRTPVFDPRREAHAILEAGLVAVGVDPAVAKHEAERFDPRAALVLPDPTRDADDARIRAAAEATGLQVTRVSADGTGFVVTCGPHVPAFTGATVAEVVARIAGYNCKHCGSGGSHTPNCGRPR